MPHARMVGSGCCWFNDPFFLPAGAEAFRRDVPGVEIRFVEGGHFVLDEAVDDIAALMRPVLDRLTAPVRR